MKDYKFCPFCRSKLKKKHIEGRERLFCADCGWIRYLNPVPAVAALVKNKRNELLLIKRAVEPQVGEWCLPGGFVELGESLTDAGVRELEEETSIKGEPRCLVGVHIQKSRLYSSVIVIGFEYAVKSGRPSPGDDALDARFFPLKRLPVIPFASHRKLIKKFISTA